MRPDLPRLDPLSLTRRHFLRGCGVGLGSIAAAQLLADEGSAAQSPPHRARAKHVIYLQMSGAPPQHDLFDPKPRLQELDGALCPDSVLEGKRFAFIKGHPTLLGSPYGLRRVGREGVLVGERMPHFASIVDDVTLVRSMWTDQFNHAPADLFLFTGSPQPGAASLGSWASYGLGSPNRDLPAFCVMVSGGATRDYFDGIYTPGSHFA
jgi:hypothetical protein